jgi:membrane-associated phospholipid phosphatase
MSASTSRMGDLWGTGVPQVLIFAGQTYFDRDKGIAAFEGFALGGIVVHSMKQITARERPNSSTKTAMPSGHSQAAFSIAASMTESYGWKVGLPFWGMGVFTGLSRLADNAHWLSDVVAGATLGTFFGRAGFTHHRSLQPVFNFRESHLESAGVAAQFDF